MVTQYKYFRSVASWNLFVPFGKERLKDSPGQKSQLYDIICSTHLIAVAEFCSWRIFNTFIIDLTKNVEDTTGVVQKYKLFMPVFVLFVKIIISIKDNSGVIKNTTRNS